MTASDASFIRCLELDRLEREKEDDGPDEA